MRSTRSIQSGVKRDKFRAVRQAALGGVEALERRKLLANIVVNTTADNAIAGDGLTTLREAILAANATPAVADAITFDLGTGPKTINLASKLPDLSTNMTIQGGGADLLTVRRNSGGDYTVLTVPAPATVTLAGLTVSNGQGGGLVVGGGIYSAGTLTINDCVVSDNASHFFSFGGGILNVNGTLTINNTTIRNNSAGYGGGGVYNTGTATLVNCTVSDNTNFGNSGGGGAGIYNTGNLTVRSSTISGNDTGPFGWEGGGIASGGTLVVESTTFQDNTARTSGGGIWLYAYAGSARISNCTFTGNEATLYGGGAITAAYYSPNSVEISHCTITGNSAGGSFSGDAGGVVASSTTTLSNSIIAGNTVTSANTPNTAFDVSGNYTDGGYNFIGGDPKLAPLADNGGPTQTMALLPDSTCINRGDPNFAGPPDFDQRGAGFARKVGPRIDIGAFESDVLNTPPTATDIPAITAVDDGADSVINLRDFFEDAEDGAAVLVYTIVGNTNPILFTSASVDEASDALTLDYAQDTDGVAAVTVRATDTGGLFVEETFDVTVILSSYVVNTTADNTIGGDGLTTLREAMTAANLNTDADTITFALGAGQLTINLTGALPSVSNASIQGPGPDLLTVRRDTGGDYNVFSIDTGSVTLAGMTITNGTGGQFGGGGGVLIGTAAVVIDDCIITGNSAHSGAGIYNWGGTLTANDTVISDNVALSYGGGIYNNKFEPDSVTLNNCVVSGNSVGYDGGGIYSDGLIITGSTISDNNAGGSGGGYGGGIIARNLTLTDSTVDGNTAALEGGGIALYGGDLTVTGSTISNNRVAGEYGDKRGGGVLVVFAGTAAIRNSTIANNTVEPGGSGGGIYGDLYTFTLSNSTVAGNTADSLGGVGLWVYSSYEIANSVIARSSGGDLSVEVPEGYEGSGVLHHNFIGDDHPGVDPMLGSLADNGGPTWTMAPLPGSPLIDAGDPNYDASLTQPFDQRGAPYNRIIYGRVDIGAVEYEAPLDFLIRVTRTLPGLNDGNRNSLMVKLNLKGNDGDADKVAAFIDHVQSLAEAGKIAQPIADVLVAIAEDLLESLA